MFLTVCSFHATVSELASCHEGHTLNVSRYYRPYR
jgi:hypothetical protein